MSADFSLLIGIGAALGLLQVARHAPSTQTVTWMNAGLYVLVGALVGARIDFVLMHLGYFQAHPLEGPQIWLGGLGWPGALLVGLLVAALIAYDRELSLAFTLDCLAPLAIPLAIGAWLGSWRAGSAYGPLLAEGAPFAMLTPMGNGLLAPRLPVQLLATLSLLVCFVWLELKPLPLERPGQSTAFSILVLSANLLFFSLLRDDPAPLWRGLRPDVWAAIAFTGLSVLSFAATFWPSRAPKVAAEPHQVIEQP